MGPDPTAGKKGGDCQARRPAAAASATLQFLAKKLREQRLWKVEKMSCSWMFVVLQLPKKFF
jgi:hypothetical protein